MKAAEQLLDETTRRGPAGMGEPIDMAALLGREKFEDFLRQLEAQLSDFLARLCDQPPDVAAIRRHAHALVASAGMLGFRPLCECCTRIETSPDAMSARNVARAREICAAALAEISRKRTPRR